MTGPISRNRLLGSLTEAAGWPGADRNTVVTLATALVAARADAEGSRYFQDLAHRVPGAGPAAAGGRGAGTVRAGPGRGGPAAGVHEFLGDCAGRDAGVRAGRAQSRAGRARRPVL